ncbi:MAG: STAS domain-containing protein [Bacteroidales bacterium]|jgi:anti-sigma B factor antagonist|nr:STAS domain-containing protein [Bacteroidales bacterium]
MEIHITESKGTLTARFVGRLDTPAAADATRDVQPLIDGADKTIILDCSEMAYISSSGLRIFLTIRKAAAAKGGKVIIEGLSNEIRQVFMMTGFLQLFEIR